MMDSGPRLQDIIGPLTNSMGMTKSLAGMRECDVFCSTVSTIVNVLLARGVNPVELFSGGNTVTVDLFPQRAGLFGNRLPFN